MSKDTEAQGCASTIAIDCTEAASTRGYNIPDLLRDWPYKRKLVCPYYLSIKTESMKWLETFNFFTPEMRKAFDKADFSLFPAMVYPLSTSYVHRSCTDMIYTFFVLDDLTDILDAKATRIHCEATLDAILHPDKERPVGEPIIGEIALQFWKRALVDMPQVVKERFIVYLEAYLKGVVLQSQHRDHAGYVCTLEEYMLSRRDDVGALPCLAFLELSLGIDIPHNVMEHPFMAKLNRDVTDMVLLSNDIYSYKKEILLSNATYNAITVIMKANNETLAGAIQTISQMHDDVVEDFLQVRDDILNKRGFPSFGENLDCQIVTYIDGLGQFIYGHEEWSFASGRYLGNEGPEIRKTRHVVIA